MGTTTHLMTAEELIELQDDGHRHELVKGVLLTMSPPATEHGKVQAAIIFFLKSFAQAKELGTVYGESGFKLETDPDTVLAPDASFIRSDRVGAASKGYHFGAPDLAVEVISPSERKSKVEQKTQQWLSLGTRAVWLIRPQSRTVEVVLANGQRTVFTEADELVDDLVIPGFRVPVADIFR